MRVDIEEDDDDDDGILVVDDDDDDAFLLESNEGIIIVVMVVCRLLTDLKWISFDAERVYATVQDDSPLCRID